MQMCEQEATSHFKKHKDKHGIETKLCVSWADPGDEANMLPQDCVVAASHQNWRAPASTQIKRSAQLQRGAL